MQIWTKPIFAALLLSAVSVPAYAGFDEDVSKAYAPYRVALFKSNQKDGEATKAAINKFLTIWDGSILPSYQMAPARYADEMDWPKTLNDVKAIAVDAKRVAEDGNLEEAHEILEAIRDELDALRDRNGIRVFSNFINAYHTEMEHLFTLKVDGDTWSPKLAGEIREQTGILKYLSGVVVSHAPEDHKDNAEFQQLLSGLNQSIQSLSAALDSNDPAAVAKAIGMLKPAYAKLFLKFG